MTSSAKKIYGSIIGILIFALGLNPGITSPSPSHRTGRLLTDKKLNYRSTFGKCPSRTAGALTLTLIKDFERNHSLKRLKEKIVKKKLAQKHFISDYKINYDPLQKLLRLNFDCPEPLMKVQIYKENGNDSYDAILVDNGKLFDPTYEVLLKVEKKLTEDLPFLALPVGEMEEETQIAITRLVMKMGPKFRKKLSEVILNKGKELTIIISSKGQPSSVFLGKSQWEEKISKLKKIVKYMELKKKIPAIINLTNSNKVVVKFNDKF
ncbi:MAG: cell division protein FtsQ [Halobacteriovoraceae bacterium]|jgi:hypothetical protein|nr:cell division protein FtsQ [Halobacteriovoraceae bacterium]MBT5095495.1 cell division protein FtsQ [Halobacteriovoraceae bacterium]